MKKENKIEEGKNGIRSYDFERVQKNKSKYHYQPEFGGWTETFVGMFYTKNCLYCQKIFEGRRVDTAFCCQSCQKAHLRQRRRKLV